MMLGNRRCGDNASVEPCEAGLSLVHGCQQIALSPSRSLRLYERPCRCSLILNTTGYSVKEKATNEHADGVILLTVCQHDHLRVCGLPVSSPL